MAGLPLEFECLDDGQGPKRQNCELEYEDDGERHRREDAAVDGIEPVEGQYERADCHQRT